MVAVGVVTLPPATTSNGADAVGVRSVLVTTDNVLAPAGPLVSPRRVIRSWSLALTIPLEKNVQRVTPLVGCGQEPTSAAVLRLRTVPLCQLVVPVPAGSVTVIELPASPDRPPVPETRKSVT